MAALDRDRSTPEREGVLLRVPVAAAAKIYAGSLAAASATGFLQPAATAADIVVLGRADEHVDNSGGADGDATATVRRGVFRWANSAGADEIENTDVGKDCYAVDDQTVALTSDSNARSKAGKIVGVDGAGVWVETR